MPEERYQGWKNYSTWAVNLWIDNTQEIYNEAREVMLQAARQGTEKRERVVNAADALKEWLEESMPEELDSPWQELLQSGWDDVDWDEIAEHHLGEMGELLGPKEWRPRRNR